MRVGAAGAHLGRNPDRLHEFFPRGTCAQCRLRVAMNAVVALCHVGNSNRDHLLHLRRQSPVRKNGLTERFEGRLLVGGQIAPAASDLGR
jgi:hypothetical protein